MKITLLCLFLTVSGSAFGAKTPSDDDINDIQKQIYLAKRMDKQIGAAIDAVLIAEKSKQNAAHIIVLKNNVEREMNKQSAARSTAIRMTITAYGLEPASISGTSVMPSTYGRKIPWMPIARESGAHDVRDANGKVSTVKQPKEEYFGITYMDGVTVMDPGAFENGPGFLASYLLHERVHFEQITTDGKGNRMTYAALQQEAYQAQVDNASHFFNPKNDPEGAFHGKIKELLFEQKTKVEAEEKESKTMKGRLRGLLPRSRPADIFDAKVHTNAELADISALVATARSQADISRRDREEREARAAEPPTRAAELEIEYPPLPAPPIAYPLAVVSKTFGQILPDIKGIAEVACKYRGHIPIPRGFFVPNQPYALLPGDDGAAESARASMSGCEAHVFGQIYKVMREERGDQITEQWFANTVASTPAAPPPPTQGGGYVSPPQNGGGGDPCRENGNLRCP